MEQSDFIGSNEPGCQWGGGKKQQSTAQTVLESGRLFCYLKSHACSILEHFSPFGNNRHARGWSKGAKYDPLRCNFLVRFVGNLNPIMFDVRAVDFYWHQQAS